MMGMEDGIVVKIIGYSSQGHAVFSTHMAAMTVTPIPENTHSLFWPPWTPGSQHWYTDIHTGKTHLDIKTH